MADFSSDVDILIIGGGVIGCAVARELGRYSLKTVLIEKSSDLVGGASRANTGLVHAGYDPVPGTDKARLNIAGARMFEQLTKELKVPFGRNGALVVGFEPADHSKLEALKRRGVENGVERIELMSEAELRNHEPVLTERACCALHAPDAGIVSPYELTFGLAENAYSNGVAFQRGARVTGIKSADGRRFTVTTTSGAFQADIVINAAGLYSDEIARLAGANDNDFTIHPRRGEYLLLDKGTGINLKHTIFQLPTKLGKGVVVTPTVSGNILLGPNAEDLDDKADLAPTYEGQSKVFESAKEILPDISPKHVITTFAGLRSISSIGDFIIGPTKVEGFINSAAIASPGLTAAPAIALEVVEYVREALGVNELPANSSFNPIRPNPNPFYGSNPETRAKLIASNPQYSNVVCRCEHVTEADVRTAVRTKTGAHTLDGIKLRTRAGMGRCQGGYCTDKVMKILSDELKVNLIQINKNEPGSWILSSRTKLERGRTNPPP
jgi:glycerol-3-phosphate dehydrogenase